MGLEKAWEEIKDDVRRDAVTPAYVSNMLSISEDMAICIMNDWKKLFEYELNIELQQDIEMMKADMRNELENQDVVKEAIQRMKKELDFLEMKLNN